MTTDNTLSRPIIVLFLGYALNFLGSGMTMPFLMVYLHLVRGFSLPEAGMVLGLSSATGLLLSPLVGYGLDHFGSLRILFFSLFVLALGTAGYAVSYTIWIALLSAILNGIGNAGLWNGLSSKLGSLTEASMRSKVFGIAYAVQNLGLGLGSGIAGFIAQTDHPNSFVNVFLIDALTYVLFVPFLWPIRKIGYSIQKDDKKDKTLDTQKTYGGYGEALRDRGLLLATLLNLMFVIFGFSQMGSSFSTWATGTAHVGTRVIGIAFFANCMGIAVAQLPVLRLTSHWRRTRLAAMASVGFMLCWLLTVLAGVHRGVWTSTWLIVAFVIFGIGETFLSPSLSPLVNALAPESLRGRYNATFGLSWQAGMIIGPILAGFALPSLGSYLFYLLALICGVCIVGAIFMEKFIPIQANQDINEL